MKYKRIEVFTNIKGLKKLLKKGGVPVEKFIDVPKKPLVLNDKTLYVAAFFNTTMKKLGFIEKHASKDNFIAFCPRPGSGYTVSDKNVQHITFLTSEEKILSRAAEEALMILKE